ncbi:uncharacterized protein LOC129129952 isoform X2 [Agelaius phoeniceus]|uniref:uncharacterized protein LOC129129952 isoform X2 n=1 Tax=Agelaius phoeniceus TaxID=39638 RepID=UPI004054EDF8
MEERRKKRSPQSCLAQPPPAGAPRPLPPSKSASFALPLPALPSPRQRPRPRRASKERARAGAGGSRGAPLQHSFLTDVSDVCEMERGLLSLLSDFHSGKLQAFGKECSFEQLEHVREMQEKLARLHFGLDVCVEELPEEQKKAAADRNLDQLLAHLCLCSHSWKSSAVPYRSCTWPRARTPRTRGPDPGSVPATPGSPARAGPGPCPRHGGGGRGSMTSAGGAGAMAAAPGPRAGAEAEAEGRRRLLRSVTRLQACARGFLLRRRLRSVREEFEAVVLEIEGDLRQLRWSGRVLQRPRFSPEDAPGPVPAGFGAPGAARPAQPSPGKPSEPGEAAENKKRKNQEKPNPGGAERGGSCGNIPPPNPKNAKPPPKPPDLGCGAAETKTIPRKTREKLNPGGAERGGNIPPSAPLPRGTTPDPKNPKTTPKPPDLGCGAAESPEEEEEGALEWDSDSSELGASPGIPEELQGLPPQG